MPATLNKKRRRTRKKRNTIEKDFQEAVIAKGEENKWWMYSVPDSRLATARGYLDLTMMHAEKKLIMGAELKAPKGRLTKEQIIWMTILSNYYPVHLWRPEHIETIEYMFKHGIVLGDTQYPPNRCGEMADALVLETSLARGVGSTPSIGTNFSPKLFFLS